MLLRIPDTQQGNMATEVVPLEQGLQSVQLRVVTTITGQRLHTNGHCALCGGQFHWFNRIDRRRRVAWDLILRAGDILRSCQNLLQANYID